MPTPVSTARQCLTPESAHALDEAVSLARRRGHTQTTSLHAVSALLSLPSSTLRAACARARNTAYSPRLQFKALLLCLSVSLDRLPATQIGSDPPVSNSFMAAIKRSQASQRRQPENYHLYHQLLQQSSVSCVKVELQYLILSILDDPVVSRVFSESGFRSFEIKLAILRPFRHRNRAPPLFLCNLTDFPDPVHRGSVVPISGFHGSENSRRIAELLGRDKGKNPLLVGVYAYDALNCFLESVKKRVNCGFLPMQLSGLEVICMENYFSKFISKNSDEGSVNLRFWELGQVAEQCLGAGIVLNLGDVRKFVGENVLDNSVKYIVEQLTRLLEIYGKKVWLIGATERYETYLKFVGLFPSVEKDWDLQLLSITSSSLSSSVSQSSYPMSRLMESFVPLGGFFSTPFDSKTPLSGSDQFATRCNLCNEKCQQEVLALSSGDYTSNLADQFQSSLPSWLQMSELGTNTSLDVKTRDDDGMTLSAKVTRLNKKWDNICRRLHHNQPVRESNQFAVIPGFRKNEHAEIYRSIDTDTSSNKNKYMDLNSHILGDSLKVSTLESNDPFHGFSKAKPASFLSKLKGEASKTEDIEPGGDIFHQSPSDSSISESSQTSLVSAGLGLGICSSHSNSKQEKDLNTNNRDLPDETIRHSPNFHLVNGNMSRLFPSQSSSSSSPNYHDKFDPRDVKKLIRELTDRVGLQDEAITVISQTICRCRTSSQNSQGASLRRDIWLNFVGPDKFIKVKVAISLAEIIYGDKDHFIFVDLSSEVFDMNQVFDCKESNSHDAKFRGKTVVDFVAGELRKKPLSVVFLENVDKADFLVLNSLAQAIRTGKFSDLHGREVSISNAIFVTSSSPTSSNDKILLSFGKEPCIHSEERILIAKFCPIQITTAHFLGDQTISQKNPVSVSISEAQRKILDPMLFINKRKLNFLNELSGQDEEIPELAKREHRTPNISLDLNVSPEENEPQDTNEENSDDDESISENSKAWLQDFCDHVDETVVFFPFDFNALAEKIMMEIEKTFRKTFGSEFTLEIDSKVMEQLVAASYTSYRKKEMEEWFEQVLGTAFSKAKGTYSLSPHSVVKLASCEGALSDEKGSGVEVPPRIVVN